MHRLQQLLLQIPRGKVTTYKELAHAMGTKGYRYVGQLLHINPDPDRFPCCKVVKSDGSLGGFANGSAEKIQRLKAEGIVVRNGKVENFNTTFYRFPSQRKG
ncbi:MGMT family protein [Candidatus Peregrinibacteria bacterium]|nr:MGMT family protein [Candidatus Peregrinibacteria bacterium]